MAASGSNKLKARFQRVLRRSWHWWREKPLLLLIPVAGLPFLVEQLAPEFVDMVAARLGLPRITILLLLVALLAAIAISSLVRYVASGSDDPVEPFETDLERVTRLDDRGVDRVQEQIIRPLFHDASPVEDEIRLMYRKNPEMGVAIRSRSEDALVAFACAWPLNARAAERLLAGRMVENDLRADDILPASRNRRATHLLVPVIAVRDPGTKQGVRQNWALRAAFRDLICDVYFGRQSRPITFVATGFSRNGRRVCEQLGMVRVAEVEMGGEKLPIFTRTMTRQEVRLL